MTMISQPEDHIVEMANKSLTRPDDFGYWGNADLFNTWGWAGIDFNRDSGVLDRSNYQAFWRDVVPLHKDSFLSEQMNHWAVGWVERTLVKVLVNDEDGVIFENITDAFCETISVLESLSDYPVLDDALYSEMEWEENLKFIEYCAPEMIDHQVEGWSEKLLSSLLDNDVEMCPDADCYASEEEMKEAAYSNGLCSKHHEEEWLEYCFDNNITKPAIFQPKQTTGQIGMRI